MKPSIMQFIKTKLQDLSFTTIIAIVSSLLTLALIGAGLGPRIVQAEAQTLINTKHIEDLGSQYKELNGKLDWIIQNQKNQQDQQNKQADQITQLYLKLIK